MKTKTIVLLIDHFNCNFEKYSLSDLLIKWLDEIIEEAPSFYNLTIRCYGGWMSNNCLNEKRYKASAFYQKNIPSIMKIIDSYVRINFEFADYIYPSHIKQRHQLNNTLIFRKSKNYFTKNKNTKNCENPNCELKKINKWMKSKNACTFDGCKQQFSDFFLRAEQKQVDTAIVSDLMAISIIYSEIFHVGLLSNDLDFAPAFLSLTAHAKNNISSIRTNETVWYIDHFLEKSGIKIIGV